MQVVCPQCGSPIDGDFAIEAEREVSCQAAICDWSGSSRDLVTVMGNVADPRLFDTLSDWILTTLGQDLALLLKQLGLLPIAAFEIADLDAVRERVVKYVIVIVRSYVAGLMEGVLDPDSLLKPADPVAVPFIQQFGEQFEPAIAKSLIELGIVKKDKDPDNIRYLTELLRHASRKMWAAIQERNGEQDARGGKPCS